MHTHGHEGVNIYGNEDKRAPQKVFPGDQLKNYASYIKDLVARHKVSTILDYGAGKGLQYSDNRVTDNATGQTYSSMKEYWGVESIECFDPGVEASGAVLQDNHYGGVISTDVLEHCYIDDVPWIVEEMFSLAEAFVFVNIACYPAMTILPNGENAHITIRNHDWWSGLFASIASRYPAMDYLACCMCPTIEGKLRKVLFSRSG